MTKNFLVTGDIPSNYNDKRLPILDLKVWIGEVKPNIFKIITAHYIKDVSTRAVINNRSSHPLRMKKNVMINEVMRILRNCNEYCPWDEVAHHISYFMKRLQFSGYDQVFRYETVRIAIKKHGARNEDNTTPKKIKKDKNRWFRKDDEVEAVMFVQATKNESLKKEVQTKTD